MNTFVTEAGPLHHLHRAGYVVAPEMVEAHRAEAERIDRLIDLMDDAFAHWTDIERHGPNAVGSRREAMREFVRVVDEFGGGWAGPVTAMLWAAQRHRNRVERAWDEAIDLDPQARELAIFRTNASRHLSGDVLVQAVDVYADDLRKRAARIPAEELDWHHMHAWEMHAEMGYYSPFHCPCCLIELPTHAEGCLLDEPTLEATRARLLDLTPEDVTPEGLDLYTRYLLAKDASR